jgi:hypothetical protein
MALDRSRHKAAIEETLQRCEDASEFLRGESNFLGSIEEQMERYKKRVHFLHTSKTGGTFFCACAWANGKNRAKEPDNFSKGLNCHYMKEDRPCWRPAFTGQEFGYIEKDLTSTPSKMLHAYGEQQIDVEGDENYLPDFGLSDKMTNVVFLRPAVDRLLSHGYMVNGRTILNWSIDEYIQNLGMLADNYFTRTLAGKDAFYKPVGTLNITDFQRALENLHQFDVYLLVDKTLVSNVQSAFGWDCSVLPGTREGGFPGGAPALQSAAAAKWGKEGLDKLESFNIFDHELYQQGLMLAAAKR